MPSRTQPLALPGAGQTSPSPSRFAPPPPEFPVSYSTPTQEWQWRPPVRIVAILIGIAALVGAGILVLRGSPTLPSWREFWPAEAPAPSASSEPIPDAHPRSTPRTLRAAPTPPESRGRTANPAPQAGAQQDVLTVVATPAESAADTTATSSGVVSSPASGPSTPASQGANTAPVVRPESGSAVALISTPVIYSALDADVTPPETVNPQKLGNLRTGTIGPDDKVTIEVVVNQQGIVEAAWGRTSPRTVGESLLLATSLHAVKSWLFHPAMKDGMPVAYRKLITFEGY